MKTIILILLILAIVLSPMAWFAWRAGQPMDLAQFNGLTYYEFLSWRKLAYQQLAEQYRAANPGEAADTPCHLIDLVGESTLGFALSGFYTMAGIYPELQQYIPSHDIETIPQEINWRSFLPSWWGVYEKIIWVEIYHMPSTPVAYCRIQPYIPSPTELSIMMGEIGLNP